MNFPDFFSDVPPIDLIDPLAELLGSAEGGVLRYRYEDAVRLAGHSCPTVAGAWLLTTCALRALYGDALPVRGQVAVHFSDAQDSGVTGVMASIAGLLTGAAGIGGFKGLGGRFRRAGLLDFSLGGEALVRFTRTDTSAAVDCTLDLSAIPPAIEIGILLPLLLKQQASADEQRAFAQAWQARVRDILLGPQSTALVQVRTVTPAAGA